MAKKTETDLVSVEMTQEQLAEFTAMKLKKEKEAVDAASNEGFMWVDLFTKHSFGRAEYGPGRTKVPVGLAGQIIYQDQHAQGREIGLNTTNKRLVQIMQSGQRIEMSTT